MVLPEDRVIDQQGVQNRNSLPTPVLVFDIFLDYKRHSPLVGQFVRKVKEMG